MERGQETTEMTLAGMTRGLRDGDRFGFGRLP